MMSKLKGAAELMIDFTEERSYFAVSGCFAKSNAMGGTNGSTVTYI